MIKGAIIGLGKMGISHAAIVGAHTEVKLVGVCDTSSLVLEVFKKFSTTITYTNYQKMIDDEKPDFVVVATPTKYHYSMVKYALERNIHVFCEKPFCLIYEEGSELVDLAKQKSLINQIGYHNHFIGTFRELKRLLDVGVLGKLLHFTGEAYGPVITKEKGKSWRSNTNEGGGCLFDYASHVLNLIQEILGYPSQINGTLLKSYYSKGVEDAVYSLLTLQNNLSGVLLVNWSDETFRKMSTTLTIQGTNGKILCDATEIKIYLKEAFPPEKLDKGWTINYITDLVPPTNYYLRGEEYSLQIDYFIQNVIDKQQGADNTFQQGLYTDKVIEMIINSAKQNING